MAGATSQTPLREPFLAQGVVGASPGGESQGLLDLSDLLILLSF